MLLEERFPQIWLPTVAGEDLRQLLWHRCRLVRLRTKLRNQLDAIAKNEGLVGQRAGTQKGRQQLEALPLAGWYQQRRQDLFELLDELEQRIVPLNQAVQQAAAGRVDAQRLMTHRSVGPIGASCTRWRFCKTQENRSQGTSFSRTALRFPPGSMVGALPCIFLLKSPQRWWQRRRQTWARRSLSGVLAANAHRLLCGFA